MDENRVRVMERETERVERKVRECEVVGDLGTGRVGEGGSML